MWSRNTTYIGSVCTRRSVKEKKRHWNFSWNFSHSLFIRKIYEFFIFRSNFLTSFSVHSSAVFFFRLSGISFLSVQRSTRTRPMCSVRLAGSHEPRNYKQNIWTVNSISCLPWGRENCADYFQRKVCRHCGEGSFFALTHRFRRRSCAAKKKKKNVKFKRWNENVRA